MTGWNSWVSGAEMTLSEVLEAFKSARLGLDVHDKFYWTALKIIELAIKEGNANFDVEMAKGEFKKLADRLDDSDAKLSGISAAPKGTFSTYTDLRNTYPGGAQGIYLVLADGHWYYWKISTSSWTSGGIYQGTQIPDDSITYEKLVEKSVRPETTNFLEYGSVVPPSNGVYTSFPLSTYRDANYDGYQVQENGNITTTSATLYLTTTHLVPLISGLTYKAIFRNLLYYDANGNHLAGTYINNTGIQEMEFTVPLSASQARFSVPLDRVDNIDNIQVKRLSPIDDDKPLKFTKEVIGLGGGGGEAYDQSLNTTDGVKFVSVETDSLELTGAIRTGTLANPPSGLLSGDMWADTTDNDAHPIVRVKL